MKLEIDRFASVAKRHPGALVHSSKRKLQLDL